jgi:hypothetical protein
MTATAMKLTHATEMSRPAKMARTANSRAAEMAATTDMRATKARTATVESTATAKMRAAAPATTTHVNATAMTASAATRARIRSDGESRQKGRRYDRDFEKLPHGLRLASENNVQTLNVRCVRSFHRNRALLSRPGSLLRDHALACQCMISQS